MCPPAFITALRRSPLGAHRAVLIDGAEIVPKETDPVGPVPDEHVWAVCKHLPETLKAMVLFEYWTGCRPQDVCRIRPVDIDTSGKVWLFRPAQHKTSHKGKVRIVYIGPKAQDVIRPFLTRDLHKPLFSPGEAMRQRSDARVVAYKKPERAAGDYRTWPSYRGRRAEQAGRECNEQFEPAAYARAIARVCKDEGIPPWSPNRLRHNAATRLRKHFDLDEVQAVLGHTKASTTEIYAKLDLSKAVKVMERVG